MPQILPQNTVQHVNVTQLMVSEKVKYLCTYVLVYIYLVVSLEDSVLFSEGKEEICSRQQLGKDATDEEPDVPSDLRSRNEKAPGDEEEDSIEEVVNILEPS